MYTADTEIVFSFERSLHVGRVLFTRNDGNLFVAAINYSPDAQSRFIVDPENVLQTVQVYQEPVK